MAHAHEQVNYFGFDPSRLYDFASNFQLLVSGASIELFPRASWRGLPGQQAAGSEGLESCSAVAALCSPGLLWPLSETPRKTHTHVDNESRRSSENSKRLLEFLRPSPTSAYFEQGSPTSNSCHPHRRQQPEALLCDLRPRATSDPVSCKVARAGYQGSPAAA